jgi:general secretion pathway protein G
MKTHNRRRRTQAGVTLIEMMVVVIIIALFAVLVGPNLFKQADKAKVTAARVQIETSKARWCSIMPITASFPRRSRDWMPCGPI